MSKYKSSKIFAKYAKIENTFREDFITKKSKFWKMREKIRSIIGGI